MEDFGPSRFEGIANTVKKRRSHTSRRPRPEPQLVLDGNDISSLSSTPPSDDIRAASSDENTGGNHSIRRKELSLSQCESRIPASGGLDGEKLVKRNKRVDIGFDELYVSSLVKDSAGDHIKSRMKENLEVQMNMEVNIGNCSESSVPSCYDLGNENKVKKVRLRVGSATRTIDADSSMKACSEYDASLSPQKLMHRDNSDNDSSMSTDKRSGLQGIPWKNFSKGGYNLGREESPVGRGIGKKTGPLRKSKRAPKKHMVDGFDDDDEEIRYLEKMRSAKLSSGYDEEESSRKHRRLSKFSGNDSIDGGKDVKTSPSEDTDYEEDSEELLSDDEAKAPIKKKIRKDFTDVAVEPREMTLMTRRRALQSGNGTSTPGGTGFEFSNGLLPAPSRKQKEKLSEVEQQLKKAEVAKRRRMQNEKAARESEAEAIRKILGQDSSRKKREEKKKKREEELAQEKEADEKMRASNSIRFIIGPNGTTVTFPNAIGLPTIFDSKPCSYPPPREICAGPSCRNPYKYRDSKTNLPLCSLHCYKAMHHEAAIC